MGRIVRAKQPCDMCGSRDNRQYYEDGSSYCFGAACPKPWLPPEGEPEVTVRNNHNLSEISDLYDTRGFIERNIFKQVSEHYNVKVSYNTEGQVDSHYYPYYSGHSLVGYKVRRLPKDFTCIGTVRGGVFGGQLYSSGKRIVITEGELDAMSVQSAWYKKYKRFYPVVSLRSSSAVRDLIECREYFRNFDEVILWFDKDEAGDAATKEAARIIGYDKVKIVNTKEKDASDLWMKHPEEVLFAIYNAVEYTPAGIVTKDQLWEQLSDYNNIESVPYPEYMEGLNEKLKGMRFGEITLWTSGTGSGKSTLLREIALDLLESTDEKIGIISLEESPAETARKMAGMALGLNPAKEEIPLETLKEGFDRVFSSDRVLVLDHQGSISDGSIMDFMEYMCLRGVKYLFVDHITILASEGTQGLTGNEAIDKIMNDLLRLVKKHNVWIGLISHLRKTDNSGKSFEDGKLPSMDDIRGSGSIKQISMDIIAFARNVGSENPLERNTIKTKVLKCRYTGLTGPSGSMFYDYDTGRLTKGSDEFDVLETEMMRI